MRIGITFLQKKSGAVFLMKAKTAELWSQVHDNMFVSALCTAGKKMRREGIHHSLVG